MIRVGAFGVWWVAVHVVQRDSGWAGAHVTVVVRLSPSPWEGGAISGVPLEGGWGRDVFCSVSGKSSSMKGSVVEMVVGDGGCCWCAAGACWLMQSGM